MPKKRIDPEDRVLDWKPRYDPRSRNFPVQSVLPDTEPVSRTWDVADVLDQGSEGSCVGHAWAHELVAEPVAVLDIDHLYAVSIYKDAQLIDEWEGEDYSGTSVLAGAKVVKKRGYMESYHWAFGVDDVLTTLGTFGPVVLGCNWYTGMDWPDEESGLITATGTVRGGHAVLIRGVDFDYEYVVLHNSWGPDWGVGGTARLPFDDLRQLIAQGAEVCVPTGRRLSPPAPEPVKPKQSLWQQIIEAIRKWFSR